MEKKNRKINRGLAIVSAVLISASFAMPSYAEKTMRGNDTENPKFQAEWREATEDDMKTQLRYRLDNAKSEEEIIEKYVTLLRGYAPMINEKNLVFGSQEYINGTFFPDRFSTYASDSGQTRDNLKLLYTRDYMLKNYYVNQKNHYEDGTLKNEYQFINTISYKGYITHNKNLYLNISTYSAIYGNKNLLINQKLGTLYAENDYAITKDNKRITQTLELKAGEKKAKVNGKEINLSNPVLLKYNTIWVEATDFKKITGYGLIKDTIGNKYDKTEEVVYLINFGEGKTRKGY